MPWFLQLFKLMPISWTPMGRMLMYSEKCVDDRRKYEPKEPDVMSHILGAGDFFPKDKLAERLLLMGDSRLLIVAGSDTTATTLVYTFYHLAKNPHIVEKIRAELKEKDIQNNAKLEVPALQYCEYLNGVINETLRLHPPVPGGVYRDTPKEGVVINGKHLPGGVKVIGPHYTIQRCKPPLSHPLILPLTVLTHDTAPKAFARPNDYIPERWTTEPDLVINKNAFFPFSMGKFGCIGKQLALAELRVVIAKMVMEFDVELAPGETGEDLLGNSEDNFTMSNRPLNLVWTERAR
jgi:tryprostatin B 6-hydroxylase